MEGLLEKIKSIINRFEEINALMGQDVQDYQVVAALGRERADLEPIVTKGQEYQNLIYRIIEAQSFQNAEDNDLKELAQSELIEIQPRLQQVEKELITLLVPKDKRDERNVIVEIRAGTGGDEAALFAAELYRLYTHYAEKRKWSVEILSESVIGIGGYKEIIFLVKGRGAFSRLKYESGVHRVQRVPVTESSGRIHTSTVTVVVLAEVEDVEIQIPESDIRVDVYRSAGAGGQNVQKNSTAIRITHIPTGIVVACQDERSQLQNRLRAMSILRARLFEIEELRRQSELEITRRSQVGTGERSEKIRTYNFPQSRVTDHRVNTSSFNLPAVMNGEIDVFLDELSIRDETERLSSSGLEGEDAG